jgi:hypothetical protein
MEVVFAFFATTTCNLSENLTSLKEYTVLDPLCFWKLALPYFLYQTKALDPGRFLPKGRKESSQSFFCFLASLVE